MKQVTKIIKHIGILDIVFGMALIVIPTIFVFVVVHVKSKSPERLSTQCAEMCGELRANVVSTRNLSCTCDHGDQCFTVYHIHTNGRMTDPRQVGKCSK